MNAISLPQKLKTFDFSLNNPLVRALCFSQVMALLWWLAALWMRENGVIVWYDQVHIFRRSVQFMFDPYSVGGFLHTPWITFLLAPFTLVSLEVGTLIQSALYFALLTGVIYKFSGDFKAVALSLTSFVALDAVLQMNVDWFVLIGLLVPVTWSSPFLLLKPQLALGYYFGVPPRKWLGIALVTGVVVGISFLFWGFWPLDIAERANSLSIQRFFNIAPSRQMPTVLSWGIGAVLAWFSFKRKDPLLGIIAWFFFTPYIAFYSLLLLFAILTLRFRKLAIIIWLATWIIYGGIYLLSFLR